MRYYWLWLTAFLADGWRVLLHQAPCWHWYYREENPYPVKCDCGWVGRRSLCFHGYTRTLDGENEPEDRCPRCGELI